MSATDPALPQQDRAPQQPSWAWAQRFEERWIPTEPLPFHRLLRGVPRFSWWKPLVALLLGGAIYFSLQILIGLGLGIALAAQGPDSLPSQQEMERFLIPDTQNPLSMLLALTTVILMIPVVWVSMKSLGLGPFGRAWSVELRIRWGLIGRTLVLAFAVVAAQNLLGLALEFAGTGELASMVPAKGLDPAAILWSALLIVVLVPVQCAAEELVFRGALMQIIGSWLRHPAFAIVGSSVVFASMHIYDIWGLLAVGMIGLTAGWLTWRTGGLEAGISLHVVNNIAAFGFMLGGFGGTTGQEVSGAGPIALIPQAVVLAVYAWLADRSCRRAGRPRTRIDYVIERRPIDPQLAAAAPVPAPAVPDALAAPAAPADASAAPAAPEASDPARSNPDEGAPRA